MSALGFQKVAVMLQQFSSLCEGNVLQGLSVRLRLHKNRGSWDGTNRSNSVLTIQSLQGGLAMRSSVKSLSDSYLAATAKRHQASVQGAIRPGAMRSGKVLVFAVLVVLGLLPIRAAGGQSQDAVSLTPRSLSDLVAVQDDKGGTTLYLADTDTGAIYVQSVPSKGPTKLTLEAFHLFFRSKEIPKPSALAYHGGRLFIADADAPSIVEVSIDTLRTRVLWRGKPLQSPVSIAVSDGGSIAVADLAAQAVFVMSNANGSNMAQQNAQSGGPGLREIRPFTEPVRVVKNGYGFMVLDQHEGTIFDTSSGDKPREAQTKTGTIRTSISKGFGQPFALRDFAFYRGIYYLTDKRRIITCVQNRGDVLVNFINNSSDIGPASIFVTEDSLFLADMRARAILKLPRQVPVSVSMDTDVQTSNAALIAIYQYLFSRGILPTRTYVANRDYATLEELLIEKNVLIMGLGGNESDHSIHEDPIRTKLETLMCKINGDLCATQGGNHALARKIVFGQKIGLPEVSISTSLTTGKVALGGRPVSTHLQERVPWQVDRSKIDSKYLVRINALLSRTIEGELTRSDFILTTPRQNLEPGTILRIEKGQDIPTGNIGNCGIPIEERKEPLNLPETVTAGVNGDYLPRRASRAQTKIDLRRLGVESVEVHFDKAFTESLNRSALALGFGKAEVRACIQQGSGSGQYVVRDALKVTGASYRLLDKGGSIVTLTEADLQRWNLLGSPDPTGKWSLIVTEPFYIGYRVSPWDKQATGIGENWAVLTDPAKIKPGSNQDFFSLTLGSLTLPRTRWLVSALVNSDDLDNETSELRKLEVQYPGVRLLSREELPTKTAGFAMGVGAQDTLETVQKNRQTLKEEISSPKRETISGRGIMIGIGEKGGTVDRRHPDFVSDGRSAFLKPVDSFAAEFEVIPASGTPPAERKIKEFNSETDHGTHVAGLLAARQTSLTPGLLPGAGLFLIDTASPANLQQSINDAMNRGVFLFNFSFTIEGNAQTSNALRNLRNEMRDSWRDQLFIVAAGNESRDLKDFDVLPIKWAEEVKNIIGVAASKAREDFLDNWVDREGITRQGSNFGKRYIHLLAPGLHVYSTTPNNTYAEATGTSQAAPQVTAAAGMLWAKGITQPLRIKARLIYTADWFNSFQNKVWGGLLNIERAVREPNRDYLFTQSSPKQLKVIVVSGTPNSIRVLSGRIDDPTDAAVQRPGQIPFQKVLRITRLPDATYRVFYLDGTTMRVLINADLDGVVACDELLEWDANTESFKETEASRAECRAGIRVSQVFDYVAKVPPSVNF